MVQSAVNMQGALYVPYGAYFTKAVKLPGAGASRAVPHQPATGQSWVWAPDCVAEQPSLSSGLG